MRAAVGALTQMRPRKCRFIRESPSVRFFKPRAIPLCDLDVVTLKDEEWEAIRLIDYDGLDQLTAAQHMKVSRPTFSRVLARGRAAVAKALAEGCALAIEGGDARLHSDTPKATKPRRTASNS